MDGMEDGAMQLAGQPEILLGVIYAGIRLPGLANGQRDAAKGHIGRQGGQPLVKDGLQVVAMRAAIGKKFDDFDLARRCSGQGIGQADKRHAGWRSARRRG